MNDLIRDSLIHRLGMNSEVVKVLNTKGNTPLILSETAASLRHSEQTIRIEGANSGIAYQPLL